MESSAIKTLAHKKSLMGMQPSFGGVPITILKLGLSHPLTAMMPLKKTGPLLSRWRQLIAQQ